MSAPHPRGKTGCSGAESNRPEPAALGGECDIEVVDHFVDVQNLSEVAWRVTNNLNPASDVVFADGPIDDLDHSSPTASYGSKMGIDATAKLGEVGRSKEWPPDIVMSDSIRQIVDKKWSKFGI